MNKGDYFPWTDEAIDLLREMWTDGVSTSLIAERLGTTKNAVVGKAHRIDLPSRSSPITRLPAGRSRTPRQSRAIDAPLGTPAPPRAAPVFIRRPTALPTSCSRECQYPFGHPGARGFRLCCGEALFGKPYCEEHDELCYVRPKKVAA